MSPMERTAAAIDSAPTSRHGAPWPQFGRLSVWNGLISTASFTSATQVLSRNSFFGFGREPAKYAGTRPIRQTRGEVSRPAGSCQQKTRRAGRKSCFSKSAGPSACWQGQSENRWALGKNRWRPPRAVIHRSELGYSLLDCSPAEPDAVSPGNARRASALAPSPLVRKPRSLIRESRLLADRPASSAFYAFPRIDAVRQGAIFGPRRTLPRSGEEGSRLSPARRLEGKKVPPKRIDSELPLVNVGCACRLGELANEAHEIARALHGDGVRAELRQADYFYLSPGLSRRERRIPHQRYDA